MKLEVKIQLLTFFSAVLNFIFLALGLSLFFCGIWILFYKGNLLAVLPSDELRTVGVGLFLIGGVVGVVSLIGCISAGKEFRLLLLIYLGFLMVLVLGQLFVTLLLSLNKGKIGERVNATLETMIVKYTGHRGSLDTMIDNIQHYEKCCGSNGSSDWLKNSYIQSLDTTGPEVLPCSCFNLTSTRRAANTTWCSKDPNITVYRGCKQKVEDWLQDNFLTVMGMGFGLMFIQAVLFILTAVLYCAIGRKAALKKRPPVDSDHAPLDYALEEDLPYAEQNYGYIDSDEGYIDPAHPANLHDYQESIQDRFHADDR